MFLSSGGGSNAASSNNSGVAPVNDSKTILQAHLGNNLTATSFVSGNANIVNDTLRTGNWKFYVGNTTSTAAISGASAVDEWTGGTLLSYVPGFTPVVSDYLIYYTFSSNKVSGTTVYDSVTNFQGTLNSATNATIAVDSNSRVTGQGYLKLSGSTMTFGSFTTGASGMSFSIWFYSNNTTDWGRIFQFGTTNTNRILAAIFTSKLRLYVDAVTVDTSLTPTNNTWYHFVWTIASNGTWIVYINGTSIYNAVQIYPPSLERTSNYFGGSPNGEYLTGGVDNFRYYNYVLSQANVTSIYESGDKYPSVAFIKDTTDTFSKILKELVNGATYAANAGSRITGKPYLQLLNPSGTTTGNVKYAKILPFIPTTNGLSFAYWIKHTAGAGIYPFFFNFRKSNVEHQIFMGYGDPVTGTNMGARINLTSAETIISTGIPFSSFADGNWHHIAWTISYISLTNSTWKFYLDGSLMTTATSRIYPGLVERTFHNIGTYGDSGDVNFSMNGGIDNFNIYHKVLTNAEVIADKDSTMTRTTWMPAPGTPVDSSETNYTVKNNEVALLPGENSTYAVWTATKSTNLKIDVSFADYNSRSANGVGFQMFKIKSDNTFDSVLFPRTVTSTALTNANSSNYLTVPTINTTVNAGDKIYYRVDGNGISTSASSVLATTIFTDAVSVASNPVENKLLQAQLATNLNTASFVAGNTNTILDTAGAGDWKFYVAPSTSIAAITSASASSEWSGGSVLPYVLPPSVPTDMSIWSPFTTTVYDSVGNYPGTLMLGAKIAVDGGRVGGGGYLSLNNSSTTTLGTYFKFTPFGVVTTGLSFSFWGKFSTSTPYGGLGGGRIFDIRDTGGREISLQRGGDTLAFYFYVSEAGILFNTPNIIDDIWRHFAITIEYSGTGGATSTYKFYVNGSLISTVPNKAYPSLGFRNYYNISTYSDIGNYGIVGGIDDFQIFNRAIDATQVSNIYSNTTPPTDMIVSYNFNAVGIHSAILVNGATIATDGSPGPGQGYLSLVAASSQYATLPPITYSSNTGLTFACWFRSSNTGNFAKILDSGSLSPDISNNIIIFIEGNQLKVNVRKSGDARQLVTTLTSVNDNVWRHLAWTISPSGAWNIYINGAFNISSAADPIAYPLLTTRSSNFIGRSNWSNDPYYNGGIDDFRFYNRAITADEVTAIYSQPSIYYPFDVADINGSTPTLIGEYSTGSYVYSGTLVNNATIAVDGNSRVSGKGYLSLSSTSTQYVNLTTPISTGANGLSFAFWYRLDATRDNQRFFSFCNSVHSQEIMMGVRSGSAYFLACANVNDIQMELSPIYSNNTWNHVVWTITRTSGTATWRIYVNGAITETKTAQEYPGELSNRTNHWIGRGFYTAPFGGDARYNGGIDDFRFYNRVITDAEVSALYAGPQPPSLKDVGTGATWLTKPAVAVDATETSYTVKSTEIALKPGTNSTYAVWTAPKSTNLKIDVSFADYHSRSTSGVGFQMFKINRDNTFGSVIFPRTTTVSAITDATLLTGTSSYLTVPSRTISVATGDKIYYRIDGNGAPTLASSVLATNIYVDPNQDLKQNTILQAHLGNNLTATSFVSGNANVVNDTLRTGNWKFYVAGNTSVAAVTGANGSSGEWTMGNLLSYVSPPTPPTDYYMYYTFDTNKVIGTTITDSSVGNYTGSLLNGASILTTNPSPAPGSGYLSMNTANSQHALLSPITNPTGGMSFAFWIRPTSFNSAHIISFGPSSGNTDNIIFQQSSTSNIVAYVIKSNGSNSGGINVSPSAINFSNGIWKHFVWTLNPVGPEWKFYLNGSLINTYTGSTYYYPNNITTTNNYIGKSNYGDPYYGGDFDDFRLYSRVITASEANAIFTAGSQVTLVDTVTTTGATWIPTPGIPVISSETLYTVKSNEVALTPGTNSTYAVWTATKSTNLKIDVSFADYNSRSANGVGFQMFKIKSDNTFDSVLFPRTVTSTALTNANSSNSSNYLTVPSINTTVNAGDKIYYRVDGNGISTSASSVLATTIFTDAVSVASNPVETKLLQAQLATNLNTASFVAGNTNTVLDTLGSGDWKFYVAPSTSIAAITSASASSEWSSGSVLPYVLPPSLPTDVSLGYTFNSETMSGTTVSDFTGTYTGTLVGGATIATDGSPGPGGGYLSLTKSFKQYFRFKPIDITTAGFTIAMWFRATNANSVGNTWIFDMRTANGTFFAITIGINTTSPGVRLLAQPATDRMIYDGDILDNVWRHLAITIEYAGVDGEQSLYKCYMNGILQSTNSDKYPRTGTRNTNNLGNVENSTNALYVFDGGFDDFRHYNRAITAEEVSLIYSQPSMYFPLNVADINPSVTTQVGEYSTGSYVYNGILTRATIAVDGNSRVSGQGYLSVNGLSGTSGSAQYLTLPTIRLTQSTGFSISLWVYPYLNNDGFIFDFRSASNGDNFMFACFNVSSSKKFVLYPYGYDYIFTENNSMTYDKWNHVCITISPTNFTTIYVDSVSRYSNTPTVNAFSGDNAKTLAKLGSTYLPNNGLGGGIDDFRVHQRVLSPAEVSALYAGPQPPTLKDAVTGATWLTKPAVAVDATETSYTVKSTEIALKPGTNSTYAVWTSPKSTNLKIDVSFADYHSRSTSGVGFQMFKINRDNTFGSVIFPRTTTGNAITDATLLTGTSSYLSVPSRTISVATGDKIYYRIDGNGAPTLASSVLATNIYVDPNQDLKQNTILQAHLGNNLTATSFVSGNANVVLDTLRTGNWKFYVAGNTSVAAVTGANGSSGEWTMGNLMSYVAPGTLPTDTAIWSPFTTTVYDSVGNKQGTLLNGAKIAVDAESRTGGGYLSLSNTNGGTVYNGQFFKFTPLNVENTGLSFSFWGRFNTTTGTNTGARIFELNTPPILSTDRYTDRILMVRHDSDVKGIKFIVNAPVPAFEVQVAYVPTLTLFDNAWRHYAITIAYGGTTGESSTYKIYVNGSLVTTSTDQYPPLGVRAICNIGSWNDDGSGGIVGGIDDFQIFNKAIDAIEVGNIYGQPVMYHSLNVADINPSNALQVGDLASESYVYNATLANGARITSTQTKFGGGSLDLSTQSGSGVNCQHLKLPTFTMSQSTGFSVSLWFYKTIDGVMFLFDFASAANANNMMLVARGTSEARYDFYPNLNGIPITSPLSPTPQTINVWTHMCVTIRPNNFTTIYQNAISIYSDTPTGNAFATAAIIKSAALLGATHSSQIGVTGYIDDFRIYNRELTQSDVTALYGNTLPAPPSNKIVSYNFNNVGNFTGTLINGAYIAMDGSPGPGQGYLSLTAASSHYATLPSITFSSNTGLTFACWFRSTATGVHGKIMDFGSYSDISNNIMIFNSNGDVGMNVRFNNAATTHQILTTGIGFNDNVWRHLVWTISPTGTWNAYINGVINVANFAGVYPLLTTRSSNFIGRSNRTGEGDPYFNGGIDDFRMYNRAITAEEVSLIYSQVAMYFPLNVADINGATPTLIGEYSTGSYVYNARLMNGATITTSQSKFGGGSLDLSTQGTSNGVAAQHLKLPSFTISQSTGFSVSFWTYYTDINNNRYVFDFASGVVGNSTNNMIMQVEPSGLYRFFPNFGHNSTSYVSEINKAKINVWQHLCVTISTTGIIIVYVNSAVIIGPITTSALFGTNGVNIFGTKTVPILGTLHLINLGIKGYIDDFKIYHRPLSSTEVSAIYAGSSLPTIKDTVTTTGATWMPIPGTLIDSSETNYTVKSNEVALTPGTNSTYAVWTATKSTNLKIDVSFADYNSRSANGVGFQMFKIKSDNTFDSVLFPRTVTSTALTNVNSTNYLTVPSINTTVTVGDKIYYRVDGNGISTSASSVLATAIYTDAVSTAVNPVETKLVQAQLATNLSNASLVAGNANTILDTTGAGNWNFYVAPSTSIAAITSASASSEWSGGSVLPYVLPPSVPTDMSIWHPFNPEILVNGATIAVDAGSRVAGQGYLSLTPTQYFNFTPFSVANTGLSFSLWARLTSSTVADGGRIIDISDPNNANRFLFTRSNNNLNVYIEGLGTIISYNTINVFDGFWRHYAITIEYGVVSSTYKLYINGALTNTYSGAYLSLGVRRSYNIGTMEQFLGTNGIDGGIDEFQIFNRAITLAEVGNIYNNTTPPTDMIISYNFNAVGIKSVTLVNNATIATNGSPGPGQGYLSLTRGTGIPAQYVKFVQPFSILQNGITVTTWFRATSNNSGANGRIYDFRPGNQSSEFSMSVSTGGIGLSGGGTVYSTNVLDNVWRHVALTVEYAGVGGASSIYKIYINGVLQTTLTPRAYPIADSRTLCNIGGYINLNTANHDGTFDGGIDDFRIYQRPLTAEEVSLIYSQPSMYFPLNVADINPSITTQVGEYSTGSYVYNGILSGGATISTSFKQFGTGSLYVNNTQTYSSGNSQYLKLPTITITSSGFTVAFWTYVTSSSPFPWFFDFSTATNGGSLGSNSMILRGDNGGFFAFYPFLTNGTGSPITTPAGTLSNNKWIHVCITIDPTKLIKIYVDSVSQYSGTTTIDIFSNNVKTESILGATFFPDVGLKGYIDDFRVYQRAITPAEVTALYAGPQPPSLKDVGTGVTWMPKPAVAVDATETSYTVKNTEIALKPGNNSTYAVWTSPKSTNIRLDVSFADYHSRSTSGVGFQIFKINSDNTFGSVIFPRTTTVSALTDANSSNYLTVPSTSLSVNTGDKVVYRIDGNGAPTSSSSVLATNIYSYTGRWYY